ncbi:hypothetical protein FL583_03360 [Cryptosporangium phraense]|uniref:Uncharacterized protein n=1 Tax=Cryptosporangium phraense TaxID=2593070 RepID=A0A545AYP8_9ACTN|nr:hypothetical protein FL583_03360 [Cryptosporangium phraense]
MEGAGGGVAMRIVRDATPMIWPSTVKTACNARSGRKSGPAAATSRTSAYGYGSPSWTRSW